MHFTTELLVLKQHIIFASGTKSFLLLQKVTANADVMAIKRYKKIENSLERKICPFGSAFEFFFQRAYLSLSLIATKQKMQNSPTTISEPKGIDRLVPTMLVFLSN